MQVALEVKLPLAAAVQIFLVGSHAQLVVAGGDGGGGLHLASQLVLSS